MSQRNSTSIAALAAFLWVAAVAPLVPSTGGGMMPCCAGGSPCETSLQATGCCRVDAASERAVTPSPAAARKSDENRLARSLEIPAPPAALSEVGVLTASMVGINASPPPSSPPPIYLTNAALRR